MASNESAGVAKNSSQQTSLAHKCPPSCMQKSTSVSNRPRQSVKSKWGRTSVSKFSGYQNVVFMPVFCFCLFSSSNMLWNCFVYPWEKKFSMWSSNWHFFNLSRGWGKWYRQERTFQWNLLIFHLKRSKWCMYLFPFYPIYVFLCFFHFFSFTWYFFKRFSPIFIQRHQHISWLCANRWIYELIAIKFWL